MNAYTADLFVRYLSKVPKSAKRRKARSDDDIEEDELDTRLSRFDQDDLKTIDHKKFSYTFVNSDGHTLVITKMSDKETYRSLTSYFAA